MKKPPRTKRSRKASATPTRAKATKPVGAKKATKKTAPTKAARSGEPGRAAVPKGTAKVQKKTPIVSSASSAKQRLPQRSISTPHAAKPRTQGGSKARGARRTYSSVTSGALGTDARSARGKKTPDKPAKKKPTRGATAPRKPAPKKKAQRKQPSRSKAAIAARRRRQEQKAIEEQKRALRNERRRQKRREKKGQVDERDLAIGWLEHIRDDFAQLTPTSLTLTEPEAAAKTPWLVVGRYDFHEEVDYALLAEMLDVVANDIPLEAMIHPQRLTQIRVVYEDPNSKRGEGDSIVSKIGAYEFVVGDLIGEIVGGGPEDEGSLAVRYTETRIPTLYFYFSSEILAHATISPWGSTQTVKLGK